MDAILSFVVACALVAPVAADVQPDEKAETLLHQGETLLTTSPQQALQQLDKVVSDYPDTEAGRLAYLRRAEAYERMGEYDKAFTIAQEVVDHNFRAAMGCRGLCIFGRILVKQGRIVEGVNTLLYIEDVVKGNGLVPLSEIKPGILQVCRDILNKESSEYTAMVGLPFGDRKWLLTHLADWLKTNGNTTMADQVWPSLAPEAPREEAAHMALLEAEKPMMQLSRPADSLPLLDKVKRDYPGTEAAGYADLRRAEAYEKLQEYDKALAAATLIVQNNPKTPLACWGQCIVGTSLVKTGKLVEGIRALKSVDPMYPYRIPDKLDHGAALQATHRLMAICKDIIKGDESNAQALLDITDESDRQWVFTVLADTSPDVLDRFMRSGVKDWVLTTIPSALGDAGKWQLAVEVLQKHASRYPGGPLEAIKAQADVVVAGANWAKDDKRFEKEPWDAAELIRKSVIISDPGMQAVISKMDCALLAATDEAIADTAQKYALIKWEWAMTAQGYFSRFGGHEIAISILAKTTKVAGLPVVQNTALWVRLAQLYRITKDTHRAIDAYNYCMLDAGGVPREYYLKALYEKGLCYQDIGYTESATRCMRKVIDKEPDSQWAKQAREQIYRLHKLQSIY